MRHLRSKLVRFSGESSLVMFQKGFKYHQVPIFLLEMKLKARFQQEFLRIRIMIHLLGKVNRHLLKSSDLACFLEKIWDMDEFHSDVSTYSSRKIVQSYSLEVAKHNTE